MVLKRIDRSATVAFCQNAPFLATGSVAGAIDLSFSTSSVLEIFALDFANTNTDLKLAGAPIQATERFARLCWGSTGVQTSTCPYGLLAGGLADGCVCIWNPAKIINQPRPGDTRGQLLCRLSKHQGAVRGLEFNPFSPNLLASGAADGELCIWDVADPAQPSLYPAMKGAAPGPQPEITDLAWNRKVQHILATSTTAGTVVVWDLKKQRPVISFRDQTTRRRCSAVQWNPEVATQVIVASDDDGAPSLQLWDLRNSVSPLMELHGHTKGVLSASWCPQDPSFILSSGKDNRVICWDVVAGAPYREMFSPSHNWQFDVQWAPGAAAGVFATATFEGQVSVCSLLGSTHPAGGDEYGGGAAGTAATKAPAWLARPAGASFGFGGKLVSFANTKRQLPTGEVASAGTVTVRQVALDADVAQLSTSFEQLIRGQDRDTLRTFCEARAADAVGSPDAEVWTFLQTHFEADGRRFLLEKLGFGDALPPPEAEPTAAEATVTEGDESQGVYEHSRTTEGHQALAAALVGDGSDFFSGQHTGSEHHAADGGAFFDGIPTPQSATSPSHAHPPAAQAAAPAHPPPSPAIIDGPPGENEAAVHRSLLVGNYPAAVDACLAANRHADALIIASLIGGDAWMDARKCYMAAHPRPFMRVVHAVLDGDWEGYVEARPPAGWRETMAALLTSAPYDRFESLVAALAARLAGAGDRHAATLCFVCSGDVDGAVAMWNKAAGPAPSATAREALVEKSIVLGLGVDRAGSSSALGDVLARHAELLASNGRLTAAFDLLSLVPGEGSESVAALKDRIYRAGAAPAEAAPPAFPFEAATPAVHPQHQYGNAGAMPQQNGYTAAPAAVPAYGAGGGYGAPPPQPQQQQQAYGTMPAPPLQQQQQQQHAAYPSYGTAPPPSPAVFQPPPPVAAPPASMYGAPPAAGLAPPPTSMLPAVYQPSAPAPRAPSAPPPPPVVTAFQPMAPPPSVPPPPQTTSPVVTPTYAAHQQAVPTVFQPGLGSGGMGGAPPVAAYHPMQAPPVQGFQPAAPPAAIAPPPQVYQHAVGGGGAPPQMMQQQMLPPGAGFALSRGGSMVPGGAPMSPNQPHMPMQPAAPPPPPPGPPADVSITNVDTAAVPPELKSVVATLGVMYAAAEASIGANPGKRRELDDTAKKLGVLLWKANAGEVSPEVGSKLQQLCAALDAGDVATASHIQVGLTSHNWAECSVWLTALKRLIKARQMGQY